jgi:hypothetical protein
MNAKEVVGWKNLNSVTCAAIATGFVTLERFTRTSIILVATETRSTRIWNEISVKVVVRFLVPARAHITVLLAPFPLLEEWLAFFARIFNIVLPLELTREGAALLDLAG